MYEIMSADEAIRLIRDGDCICVNSFVGIENPTELHEAIYRRYQKMHEYSNAIVHAFQRFRAPFSGKIVHIFPEQSAVI